ncbi:ribonuclease HII [Spirochaetia bacterium]|nr:ribonuclease HII [Spirochaetia bacterium]
MALDVQRLQPQSKPPLLICGFDEAGRGPLAGPVYAACVVLKPEFPVELLNDSKKLSAQKRETARIAIYEKAAAWGIGACSAAEIDKINILQASLLAMRRAWDDMFLRESGIFDCSNPANLEGIVDGLFVPDVPFPCRALVKADSSVPEVMAASILAKTARDRMMDRYGWIYPEYGYEKHKGYPTKAHREALVRLGPSPIQRLSFKVKS